jgi:drug/metabolite transporter (DMT)-like permease
MLPQFDAPTFSLARYLCFGLLSCALFAWAHRASPVSATRRDFAMAAWLGLVGNVVYFIALVMAIQRTGIAYASLIVGLLPVTTTLAADRLAARAARGTPPSTATSLRSRGILAPLAVIALGVAAVNADLFLREGAAPDVGTLSLAIGVCAAFTALAAWTVYAVQNQSYLRAHPRIDAKDWATLQGIGTLVWVLVALGGWSMLGASTGASSPHLLNALAEPVFLAWTLFLGIGASWLGTALWNHGARALPPTLAGQMIVFETVFGLLYGFVFETRLPHVIEAVGFASLLSGVVWAVRRH